LSQDTTDLLKVIAVTLVLFAAATLVMLYGIALFAQYGGDLPMVGSLPLNAPPELIPLLADSRVFTTLAAAHVTATGLALLVTIGTVDMALLIVAKAVTVVIAALLGFAGGHMVYLQLTENTALNLNVLAPSLVTLAGFLVLATILSVARLRQLGNLRFAVGIALIVLGPLLLLWF
jgi:hypothetical protein